MDSRNYIPRSIENYAFDENLTGRHMVFIAGPRQVGKTLLAKNWLKRKGCASLYFNWDEPSTRRAYLTNSRFFESPARSLRIRNPWIVFDEIHKRNHWRDILKGTYDGFGDEFRFLITGSARLDLFRRAGDSLVGRYNLFHMFPLTLSEIVGRTAIPAFWKRMCQKYYFLDLRKRFHVRYLRRLRRHFMGFSGSDHSLNLFSSRTSDSAGNGIRTISA